MKRISPACQTAKLMRKKSRPYSIAELIPTSMSTCKCSNQKLFLIVFIRRRKHGLGKETEFYKAEIEISKEPYGKLQVSGQEVSIIAEYWKLRKIISLVNSQGRIGNDPRSGERNAIHSEKDNKNAIEFKNIHFWK